MKKEIYESKEKIEKELNKKCELFSYPEGRLQDFTEETIRIVQEAGHESAFIAVNGVEKHPELFHINRHFIGFMDYNFPFEY